MASPACCRASSSVGAGFAPACFSARAGPDVVASSSTSREGGHLHNPRLTSRGTRKGVCLCNEASAASSTPKSSSLRTIGSSNFFLGTPIQSRETKSSQSVKSSCSQEGRSGSAPAPPARAEGFDLWKLFGGRALTGEENLKSNEGREKLFKDAAGSLAVTQKEQLEAPDLGGFDKELGGLTGGWPGGERGVEDFVIKYPAPRKISRELQLVKEELAEIVVSTKPTVVPPPLLMPGMTVIVNNPEDPFYMYSGIVQRITDGKAGVLFEGGNWDKLITFALEDLKRTATGPPGKNPKSAILEVTLSD
ncbi:hypothetical protein CBR_g28643 [Chara braunii]|uniref:NAD(P)H-quinone oxidoreductase subunit S, chloroplastic n=1 Tax=Chara braunii TaxID=69332 RepID=A0A388L9D9_CHABU|nr:hypothetical protein CBR_g28643 [Chara braunii]|eukprot:GBG78927.1 hypothetical protein CBR_g28643 [Chara braunii]